jgi:2-polyprenyl-3-methyl-5-hydroxy-6-metoxy-1,4-benzoquinol methylase
MDLWHCTTCEYDFFTHDPTASLAADKLDETRLKSSGLDIPSRDADFQNGLAQSRVLIDEYLDDRDNGRKVLEIGCSWGYFLKLAKEMGAIPYGIEVNTIRATYVRTELGIPCYPNLETCESGGNRFRKIFLFYVLEYIPDPVPYLQRLITLLEDGGTLIVITPNLNDAIKDLYHNEGFQRFFYDEHAINYLSSQSVRMIINRLRKRSAYIETRQGYSFINHVNWFLTHAPRTTAIVGGDNFVKDFTGSLQPTDIEDVASWTPQQYAVAGELVDLITEFDRCYMETLERHDYGNQVRFVIEK